MIPPSRIDVYSFHHMRPLAVGSTLALVTFTLASIGYIILKAALPGTNVFASLFRMFLYHHAHPFQYIAIVSCVFGILGTVWLYKFGHTTGRRRWLSIFITIVLTITISSIPGGILWKIHDMQAGWFTKGTQFRGDLLWGAKTGLQVGWFIILFSIPYNLFGFIIGANVLHLLPWLLSKVTSKQSPS